MPDPSDAPLAIMARTTPTEYWNDSCAVAELEYAIARGAVGATSNPTIVGEVLKKEAEYWRPRVQQIGQERATASDVDVTWQVVEEMAARGAALLEPIYMREHGRKGRLSIQTDPTLYRDPDRMLDQGRRFDSLAPNMQVKFPATSAGLAAIEQATAEGISINATVSFSLPQAVAVAEAVERGLSRRESAGLPIDTMGPVCTLMVGRLDDWLKVVMEREGITTDPAHLEWSGVAVFKKTYELYRQRGYRLRLLSAAFRNHMQWSELIGGDVVISPPHVWQKRFVASDIEVRPRIDSAVSAHIVDDLHRRFVDFLRAYDEDGLSVDEFDTFAPTRRTLRQFQAACGDLNQLIRDVIVPNPDTV